MAIIDVQHLGKSFGNHEVLKDIDFSIEKGEVVCIIGSSGSGKSTLLRCMNMLESPSHGSIQFHEETIGGSQKKINAYRSRVGMVFQSFNLFSNMTVLENCMSGSVYVLKRSKEEAKSTALKYLKQVGMAPYIHAKPAQLSGGQKQRIAVARAMLKPSPLLILDEHTSALDTQTAAQLNQALWSETNARAVLVITHMLDEGDVYDKIIHIEACRVRIDDIKANSGKQLQF